MNLSDHTDIEIRNNVVQILLIIEVFLKAWSDNPNADTYQKLRRIRRALYTITDWKHGCKFSTRVMRVLVDNDISYSSRNNLLRKRNKNNEPPDHEQLRNKCRVEFRQLFDNLKYTIEHPKTNKLCHILCFYMCNCCSFCSCCLNGERKIHDKFLKMYNKDIEDGYGEVTCCSNAVDETADEDSHSCFSY